MRPVSRKRQRRDRVYADRRVDVWERAEGRCEAMTGMRCTGRAENVHHIAGRGGPNPHRLSNLLGTCSPCHAWIHAHPEESYEMGWMVRRHAVDPDECPVCVPFGRLGIWCSHCDGTGKP